MRHKQRPIKSSRHKSVTSLNDCPQTTFEHNNVRHMNDVMRLAFLENNDISPETWKDIDFNSLSTATILKRNIQQQLQQQLKEQQLRAKQQQEFIQQQELIQQQLFHHCDNRDYARRPKLELVQQVEDEEDQSLYVQDDDIDQFPDDEEQLRHESPSMLWPSQHEESGRSTANQSLGGFICDEPNCGKSFPSSRKLRHHKVVHSNDYPFHCQFKGCEKKFKRKFGIDLHSTTHFDLDPDMYAKTSNNSSLPFFGRRMQYSMCKPCGEKFKTVHDYQNHMLNHGKEPFKCPVKDCGQTFSIWKSFQKHRASHYFNYYCKMDPRCEHFTSNLQLLKLHIYCCHFQRKLPDNATLSSRDTQVADEPSPNMVESLSPPSTNNKRTRHSSGPLVKQTPEKKMKQLVVAELEPGSETELEPEPEYEPDFEPRHQQEQLEHDQADEYEEEDRLELDPDFEPNHREHDNFARRPKLEPVQQVEDEEDQSLYVQDDDVDQFPDDEEQLRHESPSMLWPSQHEESGRSAANQSLGGFICDEPNCGKSFPSSRKLRHHKVVHSDEHPFHCQYKGCEKKFKRKFGIDLHSTTHFDLDPDMYAKTSNNSSLPFFGRRMQYSMCKPCGEKFKTVHDYQNHMLNHGKEPFKCPVKDCGQTFSIWKSFQKHRASHYFNYYCKMDPRCEHFTSNLQLLKLHIYCCHFQRKLPDNASLSSKDPPIDRTVHNVVQSSPSSKRSRLPTLSQQQQRQQQQQQQQKQTPEKESKLPLKVLPRRACTANSRCPATITFGCPSDYLNNK